MPWLLDTNICIYIIKQKPVSVFDKFKSITPGQIALSILWKAGPITYPSLSTKASGIYSITMRLPVAKRICVM